MEVTREMQIDIFHRNDLGVSSACRSALYAKHGSERRLAKRNHYVFAYAFESVGKSYGRGGLSLTRGRRGYGGDKHEFSTLALAVFGEIGIVDFCLIFAVLLDVFLVYACTFCHLHNRKHLCLLRYLDVAFIIHCPPLCACAHIYCRY